MTSIARTAATGGALDPEFLAWSTSLPYDRRLLAVDCAGSIAHVRGLEAAGLVTTDEADTLAAALQSLPERVERGEVALPDREEDVHMAIEAWLQSEVGGLADKLHTGRSRNDQVATDLKLWCRGQLDPLDAAIDAVLAAAVAWCARHADVAMPSYTHRQVAVPVLASVWMGGALTEGLRSDRALLEAVRAELAASPLGAGAVGGTTLPLDAERTAKRLGFDRGPANPIDAVGSRDHALLLMFVYARIGLHLARLCTDIIELASDGLIALAGPIAGGSSMMPHKRNPDLFELVRGQSALRQGELVQLMATFQGLGSGYHRDLQQDKQILFAATDGTLATLRMITIALPHVTLDVDACLAALADGDALATDLCEALVAAGQPFREAYQKIGTLVATQRSAGRRLTDLTPGDLDAAGLPRDLLEVLDPLQSAKRRT